MPVERPFIDYGWFELAVPLPDVLAVFAATALFCIVVTETCIRWVAPWLKHRAGTLGNNDDDAKILELSVRTSSVLYTGVIYVFSVYDHLQHEENYPTRASRLIGFGYIQPLVAASLMSYMVVDTYYLWRRKQHGMDTPRFITVALHHFVTFIMQPVSFWCGFWQYYGNVLVMLAESTSLLSNLNVLLPDLGYPRGSLIFKINTVVFAVTFIIMRTAGLTWMMYDMFTNLIYTEEVWEFQQNNPALAYCTPILFALYFVGLAWSFKLYQILMKTILGKKRSHDKKK